MPALSDSSADRLADIRHRITEAEKTAGRAPGSTRLIAVSKTFEPEDIQLVIETGQRLYGENRVQEAKGKWPTLREKTLDIELHLIGPLQSNKAREAVELFDVIHTVDREKIAAALSKEMRSLGKSPKLFVQVNTGLEAQKAGIDPRETADFVAACRDRHGLAIAGLMCIPPADDAPGPHFALLAKLGRELDLPELSMGMSGDFETAVEFGATYVRVGSAIFGHREYAEKTA